MAAIDNAGRDEFFMVGGAGSANAMRRHQGRRHGAQGDRHLPADAGRRRHPAGPADRAGQGHVRPGRRSRCPQRIVLVRARGHQGQRRRVPADRASSPDRRPTGARPAGSRSPTGRTRHERTSARRLGVGMVGYAFMGAAHSQAWRTAAAFFDLPLRPDMAVLVRPRRGRGRPRRPSGSAGESTRDRLAGGWSTRDDIDLVDICTPGRHPRRDRDRRARGRQARAVREAAGQHGRRGRGDGRGGRAGRAPRGVRAMVGFNYRRVPAIALARQLVARGPDRRRSGTCARSTCRTGSSTRTFPLVWRLDKEQGRLRRARRHRRAHRRPGAVRHRASRSTGVIGAARDVRQASGRCPRRVGGPARRRRGTETRRGHRRRRGALPRPVRRRGAGVVRGDPVRARPQERDPARDQRLDGQPRVRLRGHERAAVLRRRRGPPTTAGLPPDPGHRARRTRTSAPGGRPGTGSGYEHAFTHQVVDLVTAIGRRARDPTPSFADGLQVQRVLDAVEAARRRTAAGVDPVDHRREES